jgi:O-succinylbenzoic acid--CoA ligase
VPGVAEVCIVGPPDEEWGQVVTAVVVPADRTAPPRLADLRDAVVPTLGPAAAPRRLVVVDAIAHRGPGKIDRAGVLAQAAAAAEPA